MGRPFNEIDPDDESEVAQFARELRELHREAGVPTLRTLATRTGFSNTALSEALGGTKLPSADVSRALVDALGADWSQWAGRHAAIAAASQSTSGRVPAQRPEPEPVTTRAAPSEQKSHATDVTISQGPADAAVDGGDSGVIPGSGTTPPGPSSRSLALAVLAGIVIVAVLALASVIVAMSFEGDETPAQQAVGRGAEDLDVGTGVQIRFDDRDGGSAVINVFAGPTRSEADRQITGSYMDGQEQVAVCQTAGRRVTADSAAGETPGTSTRWIRVAGPRGQPRYASLLYAELIDDAGAAVDLASLPRCPPA